MAEAATRTRFRVEGMDCAGCAAKIDRAVRRLPGVEDVSVSIASGTLAVRHAVESDLDTLQHRVTGLGYKIAPLAAAAASQQGTALDRGHCSDHAHDLAREDDAGSGTHGHDHAPVAGAWWQSPRGQLTIANGCALVAAYAYGQMVPAMASWAFIGAMLIGLVPIARRAAMAAMAGSPFTIETLMTIAAVGAVIIGAGEEAATVVFLFLIGELLEGFAAGQARASIHGLSKLVPRTALVERDGRTEEVPADRIELGATVLVRRATGYRRTV